MRNRPQHRDGYCEKKIKYRIRFVRVSVPLTWDKKTEWR